MTTGNNWVSTGLVFCECREFDIVMIANRVLRKMEALDQRVAGVHILSETCTLVTSSEMELRITIEDGCRLSAFETDAKAFVSVEARDLVCSATAPSSKEAILVQILKTLQRKMMPNYVKWIEGDAFITPEAFHKATAHCYIRKTPSVGETDPVPTSRHMLPAIEAINDLVQKQLADRQAPTSEDVRLARELRPFLAVKSIQECTETDPPNADIRETSNALRLAAWFLSFAVAMFALPIGAALMFFNLMRGENLRLTSQTAALTGTFVAFQAMGTTAHAMTTIQGFLG